ncbi:MAG: putative toxin-antitoxin system toxin component, PIN family [Candidatus Thermoplasmatota archaeon]|nr:putative toxin-antitoxin system toxin component, PIN family [Candidatus Thermoplasmatota archaeon]
MVIDTNVYVSGILWNGNESKIVDMCMDGILENHTSIDILSEVERVLSYGKFNLTHEEIDKLLKIYFYFSKLVSVRTKIDIKSRDPADNKILECAIASEVDYIISGDQDILSMKEAEGIKIVSSRDFLEMIRFHSSR